MANRARPKKKSVNASAASKQKKESRRDGIIWVRIKGPAIGDLRELFERAARIKGMQVSTWIRNVAHEAAKRITEREDKKS